ncbi:unnamed protein product [Dovyalis caffra]|uniref:Uncharacterized protein n=1 Tax=Dovyalis caffra TaxID=77055 RepID=A0AAV1SJR5_9ROSI|nr:unnamed protein product [Dovyalis caffra]
MNFGPTKEEKVKSRQCIAPEWTLDGYYTLAALPVSNSGTVAFKTWGKNLGSEEMKGIILASSGMPKPQEAASNTKYGIQEMHAHVPTGHLRYTLGN